MSLSKKAIKEQDDRLREKLKRWDDLAFIPFIAIPLALYLTLGRTLAMLTPLLWVIYSAAYLCLFNHRLKGFSTDELRSIATVWRNYPFRVFCWLLLIAAGLCVVAVIVQYLKAAFFIK